MDQPRTIDKAAAQARLLELLRDDATISDALAVVGRSRKTYETWRIDPAFAVAVDKARKVTCRCGHVCGEEAFA